MAAKEYIVTITDNGFIMIRHRRSMEDVSTIDEIDHIAKSLKSYRDFLGNQPNTYRKQNVKETIAAWTINEMFKSGDAIFDNQTTGGVYIVSCDDYPGLYKVGHSANISSRLKQLKYIYQTRYHFLLVDAIKTIDSKRLEKAIHDVLSKYRFGKSTKKEREFFHKEAVDSLIKEIKNENSK